jgi:hypothetical protein
MLTRTSETNDFAPDVSVFPKERNPETGGRRLEELAFEVASTQSLSDAGHKAKKLVERGVRRVFAIDVERGRAVEWSKELDAWRTLPSDATIEDPALAATLPVEALVSAAKADDALARALLAKRNAVLTAALASERREGQTEGKVEALLAVLAARDLMPSDAARARILAQRDDAVLVRWIARATSCASIFEILGEGE